MIPAHSLSLDERTADAAVEPSDAKRPGTTECEPSGAEPAQMPATAPIGFCRPAPGPLRPHQARAVGAQVQPCFAADRACFAMRELIWQ